MQKSGYSDDSLDEAGRKQDAVLLDSVMTAIASEALKAEINRAQCRNICKRLQAIYRVLKQLPDSRPTPQILTVLRSAHWLLRRMHTDGWEQILLEQFSCPAKFSGLRVRIQHVWQLHASTDWDAMDKQAVVEDELGNAKTYLKFMAASISLGPTAATDAFYKPMHWNGDRTDNAAGEDDSDPDETEQMRDVVDYYRRYLFGSWRLSFDELQVRDGGVTELHASPQRGIAKRFVVRGGLSYHGRPVVVKELDEEGADRIGETLTGFVQDATARMQWCHPDLVTYRGAFTEKFNLPEGGGVRGEGVAASKAGEPRLALGLVMDDMSVEPVVSSVSSTCNASGICSLRYESLHHLLFVRRRRFSLVDALRITLQLADALQYILLEADDVPESVAIAWMSVAPSNVYVATLPSHGASVSLQPSRWIASEDSAIPSHRSVFGESTTLISRDAACWNSRVSTVSLPSVYESDASVISSETHPSGRNPLQGMPVISHLPHNSVLVPGVFTDTYCVKYAPPSYIEGGPYSRWRPHPKAACPPCYAVAQLLLAIYTNKAPYRLWHRQTQLRNRVFEAAAPPKMESGEPMVKVTQTKGYSIPPSLPPVVSELCKEALSLTHADRIPITLQRLREMLRNALANLCDDEIRCCALSPSGWGSVVDAVQHDECGTDTNGTVLIPVEMDDVTPLDDYGEG